MVRVLPTGIFDILQPGHLLYLSEAKVLGDELNVIVAHDSMVKHKPLKEQVRMPDNNTGDA